MLTIGDADGFCTSGGVIRLYREDTKIRFEIYLAQGVKCGLEFSAKILRLAKIHEPK